MGYIVGTSEVLVRVLPYGIVGPNFGYFLQILFQKRYKEVPASRL